MTTITEENAAKTHLGLSVQATDLCEEAYISCSFVSRFQALADRIAVSCSLVRGEYNRAWNEVMLCEEAKVRESNFLFC